MDILLIHGLGRTPLSLWRLGRTLRTDGHATHLLGYVAAVESMERIVERTVTRLTALGTGSAPYAVVGHSLGNILLRLAIDRLSQAERPVHHVMLAPPNRCPRLARRIHRHWPYRVVMGEAGQRLADPTFVDSLPAPVIPYTIIAGTGGASGWVSPFAGDPNDGVVAVEETRIRADDVVIEVPRGHTFIMNDARVHQVIRTALAASENA